MSAKVIPIDSRQVSLWAEYLAAKDKAEKSGSMNDGIAAGHAWRRWLELFAPLEGRK